MTRLARFSNNAASKLAANLTSVGLTCTVTSGDGDKFPALTAGQFFMATLIKADGTKEVIKVTARATDTFTIQRAAEAVGGIQTAYGFSAGDRIELRMTAAMLGDEFDRLDLSSVARVSNRSANYTVAQADLNTLFRVNTSGGARTISLPSIAALGEEFKVLVSKVTNDANIVTIAANGADTINGLANLSLTQQWAGAWLIADKATNTWTAINSGSSSGNWVIDTFTGSGTAGPFTLSGDPGSKNNTMVWVGGVYQQKSTYTLVGTQLTLGGNVAGGVGIEVAWAAPIAFGVPNDGSVTAPKLGDGAVTEPKLNDAVRRAIQNQQYTAATTAGSGTAYTLAPSPAIAAYAAGQSFFVTFHAVSGAAPTLAISGLASPPNLLKQFADGSYANIAAGDIPANHRSRVTLLSATQAWVETLPASAARSPIAPVTASVAASALTISCGAITLDFRNATLGNGAVTTVSGTPANLVISSGSTLGTTNGVLSRLAVIALNNAGTIELAVVNLAGGVDISENGVISTTAEGGAGAADSANVVYSTTARTNVPYRILRFIESTQATAGTWATAPSLIGGSAEPLALWLSGYGKSWQTVSGRALNTTYTNNTGRVLEFTAQISLTSGSFAVPQINGGDRFIMSNNGIGGVTITSFLTVNPGDTYRVNNSSGGTLSIWSENR